MKLLTMDKPQCLLYSAAMVLDSDPNELIQEIGHDGLVVKWPELQKPKCYNGFHPQEIIDVAWKRGLIFVPIEKHPQSAPCDVHPIDIYADPDTRLLGYLTRPGILIGTFQGCGHAVAWDGEQVYDPNGLKYNLRHFKVELFLMLISPK